MTRPAARTPAQAAAVAALAGDRAAGRGRGCGRRREDHHPGRRPRLLAAQGRRLMVVTPTLKAAKVAAGRARRAGRVGGLAGAPARLALGRRRRAGPASRPATSTRSPAASTAGPATRTRRCGRVICWSSTRPGCSTRTPPARCSPSPTNSTCGSRCSVTGTSCPRSAAAACSTSPPAGPTRTPASTLDGCTASPATSRRRRHDADRAGRRVRRPQPGDAHRRRPRRGVRRAARPRPDRSSTRPTPTGSRRSPTLAADASTRRRGERRGASWPTPVSRSPSSTPRSATGSSPTGRVDDTHATTTGAGQRIGVGDRVATRRNDRDLDVANRDTWTVTARRPARRSSPCATATPAERHAAGRLRRAACRAGLRHHRARGAGRHRHRRAPGARASTPAPRRPTSG